MVNGPSVLVEPPESYTEGPFIIFNSVRKSNFCTEILIKLRPIAIARTSLIYALMGINMKMEPFCAKTII